VRKKRVNLRVRGSEPYITRQMAAVLVFSSERVQSAVGEILGVRWPRTGSPGSGGSRIAHGYAIKKWCFPGRRNSSCWTTCVRDQLTLEEPARQLARSFRGSLLLFPFAAGAVVTAPPDVANAYAVRSVEMLERHLGITLSGTQRDELHALLFEASYSPQRMPRIEAPGRAEAIYADRFVEAMRRGHNLPAPDADLFGAGGGIYLTTSSSSPSSSTRQRAFAPLAPSSSSSSEGSPPRYASAPATSIMAALRDAEAGSGCSVCQTNRASICLLPCQHQCLCDDCARQLCAQSEQPTCPLCRAPSEGAVRPFL